MNSGQEEKHKIISQFAEQTGDTGSAPVQIALLTSRIEKLHHHFGNHKKDHSSRRGLLKMVGRRRKLLNFLKRTDRNRYQKMIETLGLRK